MLKYPKPTNFVAKHNKDLIINQSLDTAENGKKHCPCQKYNRTQDYSKGLLRTKHSTLSTFIFCFQFFSPFLLSIFLLYLYSIAFVSFISNSIITYMNLTS